MESHIQLVLNQWCSRRRFGGEPRPCLFDCGHHSDALEHSIVCPCFQRLFHDWHGLHDLSLTLDQILLLSYGSDGDIPRMDHYVLAYVHVCFACFNACRHGDTLTRRMVIHRTKRMITHCSRTGTLLRQLRSGLGTLVFPSGGNL